MKQELSNIDSIKKILNSFYYHEGIERVGFIVEDNRIVEVRNVSEKPTEGFLVDPKDTIRCIERGAWATWHTHPNQDSNLSGEDNRMFTNWSDLVHFIIGSNGVKAYYYNNEKKAILEL